MLKRNISWGKPVPLFHAPIEPGPEQRVTPMPDVATALIDTIQLAGDKADLEAHHDTLRMGAALSSFKMKIGETGEVYTVTITRGWA